MTYTDPPPLPPRPGIKSSHTFEDSVWYAFMTRPQGEFAAAEALREMGQSVFVPVEYKTRQAQRPKKHQPKIVRVTYPMFRGYIFVSTENSLPWMRLLTLEDPRGRRHLRGVVGFQGRPAPIDNDAMAQIMLASGSLAQPHSQSVSTHKAFNKGDLVIIVDGAFARHDQKIEIEDVGEGKLHMFVTLFNKRHLVKVPVEHVEAA